MLCAAREGKYEERFDLAKERGQHMSRAEWRQWQEISKENAFDPEYRRALETGEWQALKEGQKQERIAFWKETGQMRKDLRSALRGQVGEELKEEWRAYAEHRAEREKQARAYDKEARGAIKHCSRLHGAGAGVRVRRTDVASRVKGQMGAASGKAARPSHRLRRSRSGRRPTTPACARSFTGAARKYLKTERPPRGATETALEKLSHDRLDAFDAVKARHRDEKAELRHDQRAGDRRHDILGRLGNQTPATALTPEQLAAYAAHARQAATQRAQFREARGEVSDAADRQRAKDPPARDIARAGT